MLHMLLKLLGFRFQLKLCYFQEKNSFFKVLSFVFYFSFVFKFFVFNFFFFAFAIVCFCVHLQPSGVLLFLCVFIGKCSYC